METTIICWIMEKKNGNWYSIFGVIFGYFLGDPYGIWELGFMVSSVGIIWGIIWGIRSLNYSQLTTSKTNQNLES